MNDYIDIYCERLSQGLWAEPVNAVTNAAFLIAAFFAWILYRKEREAGTLLLIFLMVCIGVGSGLFHTFATRMTQIMDVVPILLFQTAFIWLYALRVMKLSVFKTSILFAGFVAASIVCDQLPQSFLNGSGGYLPALAFITGFGVWHWRFAAREKYMLLLAAVVFVASLTFRSIDMAVCSDFPLGTHFLWHSLNGVVLYLCVRGYVAGRKVSPN